MGVTYSMTGYNPVLNFHSYYSGHSLLGLIKAYRKARREGIKYIVIEWHVPEPNK